MHKDKDALILEPFLDVPSTRCPGFVFWFMASLSHEMLEPGENPDAWIQPLRFNEGAATMDFSTCSGQLVRLVRGLPTVASQRPVLHSR